VEGPGTAPGPFVGKKKTKKMLGIKEKKILIVNKEKIKK
jgi:hypothetical protein